MGKKNQNTKSIFIPLTQKLLQLSFHVDSFHRLSLIYVSSSIFFHIFIKSAWYLIVPTLIFLKTRKELIKRPQHFLNGLYWKVFVHYTCKYCFPGVGKSVVKSSSMWLICSFQAETCGPGSQKILKDFLNHRRKKEKSRKICIRKFIIYFFLQFFFIFKEYPHYIPRKYDPWSKYVCT